MKRRFLLTLIVSFISIVSFSQWEEQNILPSDNFFNDVFVLDNNQCWVVGQSGIVMKSNNNGFTWLRLSSQTTEHINSVWFVVEQKGWICGNNGLLKYTSNGGYLWQESGVETENDLKDVFFVDNNTGWVVGDNGLIYGTTDGGITWESQTSGTTHDLWSVHFINGNEGWAAGYSGDILHTTNGGSSWTMQPQAVLDELFCIFFTDENHGWASGADGLLKTTDGGETWNTNLYQYGLGYRSVFFESASSGYLIINTGLDGTLHYTNDGGETWEFKNESGYTLRSMDFSDEGPGFAVGYPDVIVYCPIFGGSGGCGNITINPEITGLSDVQFLDSLNGWTVGGTSILATDDGGTNWYAQYNDQESIFRSIFFTDINIGYAASFNGMVVKTINGGQTWTPLANVPVNSYYSIYFTDNLNGWLASWYGPILRTEDGGETWTSNNLNTKTSSIFFINENIGWAVGEYFDPGPPSIYGFISKTIDGGINWSFQYLPVTIYSVYFLNEQKGWAVGKEGTILFTEDGGSNWQLINQGFTMDFAYVKFIDENNGWISGIGEFVIHTNDGGETWEEQTIINGDYIMAIDFIDNEKGWAVGAGIFHTNNGGTVGTEEQKTTTKDNLSISPNPFNNEIKIAFNLSNSSNTLINILNLKGQLVKSENIGFLSKGNQESTMAVADLSPGLYYLMLITEDNLFTQKIIKL